MTKHDHRSPGRLRAAWNRARARLPVVAPYAALAGMVMLNATSSAGLFFTSAEAQPAVPNGGRQEPAVPPCPVLKSPQTPGSQRRLNPEDIQRSGPCGPAAPPPLALPAPATQAPPPAAAAEQQQILLRGLRIVDSIAEVAPGGVEQSGIAIENLPLLNTLAFRQRLQTFFGRPVSQATLQGVGAAITSWYRDLDYPFVDVAFPAGQDITNGNVQLVVTVSHVGTVQARGNRWFSSQLLTDQVRLAPGERISLKGLEEDKDWLNQNPFRVVNIIAQKSSTPGLTDFTVETVHEDFPLRFHVDFNNSGVPIIGRDQWSYGVDWGNALWLDHQFSYTFTSAKPLWGLGSSTTLQEHSANYVVPLPWRDKLVFFGVYAQAMPKLGPDLGLTGINRQLSARYVRTLPGTSLLAQQFQFGFDFKTSNNDLEFGGTQVLSVTTEIAQILANYSISLKDALGQTTLVNELVYSPGHLSPHNKDANFQAQAAFTTATYVYDNISITRLTGLPQDADWVKGLGWFKDVSSLTRLTGQISNNNLLPSEQFAIGGTGTIPGYDEHTANGSQGILFSEELLLPAISIGRQLFRQDLGDQMQWSGFWAYGHVKDKKISPDIVPPVSDLESAGIGLRFVIGRYVNLRANYGWQLRRLPGAAGHGQFGHVALVLSY